MESSRRYSSDSVVGMACIPELFACGSKLLCLTHSAWVGETTSLMEFVNLSVSNSRLFAVRTESILALDRWSLVVIRLMVIMVGRPVGRYISGLYSGREANARRCI